MLARKLDEEVMNSYKRGRSDASKIIVSSIIESFGIDDVMYEITHKLVCEAIEKDIEPEERRKYIYDKIDKVLDRWVE